VSILLLLLRFLTAPMPAVPAAVVAIDSDARRQARVELATIEAAPSRIRKLMRGAQDGPMRLSCVQQRLAEAQVHVTLARDEMQILAPEPGPEPGPGPGHASDGDRAHARRRLELIAQRTLEVERAARLCIDDELSTVTATKFEVEVSPAAAKAGDVTSPPLLQAHPCGGPPCTVVPALP
jgi:hypothetical protein